MKKSGRIVIGLIIAAALLLILARPLLYGYYTFNSVKIEVDYKTDRLLNSSDIENSAESEYVQYDSVSDETLVKLPHKSNVITIKNETKKSNVYQLQTCFERDGDYCFVFSGMLRYFPYNDKTHRGDKLIVVDGDGNIKNGFESANEEWILDFKNGTVLLYNSKENSFCQKDITTGETLKKVQIEKNKFEELVLSCSDYENSEWQVEFYSNGEIVYKTAAPTIE